MRVSILTAVCLVTFLGCADMSGPDSDRGIRIVGGADKSDTVLSLLPAALIVEIHDSTGAVAPLGTVVRFTAMARSGVAEVTLGALTSTAFGTFATGTTDQSGRTAVLVKLGTLAGTGRVVIHVPTLGLVDTARYTVQAGAPIRVSVSPRDTVGYVGKTMTLRIGQTDQFGNARTDPVTVAVSGSGATITPTGIFSATATGRYTITVTGEKGSGSGAVSVVPEGRLAIVRTGGTLSLELVDLDGSHARKLTDVVTGGIGVRPAWMPGGRSLIYSTLVTGVQQLYVTDTNGVARPFFATPPPNVTHQADAKPTTDGQWVYFAAYDSRCVASPYCLYRSRVDGSSPELIGSSATAGSELRPSPSPDGSKVAYSTGSFFSGSVRVFDVATRTTSALSPSGINPAWSPDGRLIAYVASGGGSLSVVNPDGTGVRALNSKAYGTAQITWTPDSKFILAQSASVWELIDVSTGASLPLAPLTAAVISAVMR